MRAGYLGLWLLAGLVLAGAAQAQMHAYGLAAKVNGVGISNQTLEYSFQEYLREQGQNIAAMRHPGRVKVLRRETLDLLIDQELAWQAAQRARVLATDEEVTEAVDRMRAQFRSAQVFVSRLAIEGYSEASYREHIKRLVSAQKYLDAVAATVQVTEREVHDFYTANLDKFRAPEQIRVRHILLRVAPDATDEDRQAARKRLTAILDELRRGGDFAALATRHSDDGSAARGGDLGYFPRGGMVPPFEQAAFALQVGEVSGIVETPFGLHLIELEDRRPARLVSEAEARQQILDYLRREKSRAAVDTELQRLRSGAEIEVLLPL